jgi:beta-1,3-galactosyltransferase 1
MKCDDDTFINIPNLIHVLLGGTLPIYNSTISFYDKSTIYNKVKRNRLQRKNVLTGFLFCGVRPVTDLKSKYYSPSYMYNNEFYPNYLSGTAYLMSIDVAEKLFRSSLETPLFHLEDVFITGIVADHVKIKRKAHPLFYYATTKDRCAMRGMISQHQLTPPTEMYEMYEFVTNTTAYHCHGPSKKYTSSKMKLMNRRKCQ